MREFSKRFRVLESAANTILSKLKNNNPYIAQISFDVKLSNDENIIFIAPNEILAKFISTKYGNDFSTEFEKILNKRPIIKILSNKPNQKTSKKPSIDIENIKKQSLVLDEFLTFDNFIVGDSNHYAYEVALNVAKNPGKSYNPLFIYGSTGLGKTHLLQSIGHYCLQRGLNVTYITSEQFYNDFIANVASQTMLKFKDKYRNTNVLLIDDVQFLATKSNKVQEEFFHTFNELREKKAQIALTCDKHPKYLKGFEERLISRFESGLVADITPPELDTKIRIIKAKCKFDKIILKDDVINYMATNMGDDIREIEGTILEFGAYSRIMNEEITLDFAKNRIKDKIKIQKNSTNLEEIINLVAKELNIKISEIKSKNKTKKIVEARRICIYLAKNLTPNSMPALATHFGLKDHSAVSHNIKKINELIDANEVFKIRLEEIKNKILEQK